MNAGTAVAGLSVSMAADADNAQLVAAAVFASTANERVAADGVTEWVYASIKGSRAAARSVFNQDKTPRKKTLNRKIRKKKRSSLCHTPH